MAPLRPKKKQPSSGAPSESCSSLGRRVSGLSRPEPAPRDGRKRRKTNKPITWVKHTPTPDFDGHLWRKYGQKVIKEAPYPRLYFRCSYREDRNCPASKLVQQVTDGAPALYEVTYTHEHTCNAAPVRAPAVVAEAERQQAPPTGGLMLKFGSSSSGGGGGGGGGHLRDDARMMPQLQEHQRQYFQQPAPLMVDCLDYSNRSCQRHEQPAFPSDDGVAPAAASWSSSPSFLIIESSLPVPPSTTTGDEDDDMFSTWDWDLLDYCLHVDEHLHSSDHVQIPGGTFSWETDGSSFAHFGIGTEADGAVIF